MNLSTPVLLKKVALMTVMSDLGQFRTLIVYLFPGVRLVNVIGNPNEAEY